MKKPLPYKEWFAQRWAQKRDKNFVENKAMLLVTLLAKLESQRHSG